MLNFFLFTSEKKDKKIEDLILDYQKRCQFAVNWHCYNIKEKKNNPWLSSINKLKQKYIVVLDLNGKMLSSVGLATKIDSWRFVSNNIVFCIGGADGLPDDVIQSANFRWQLSELTLPHKLCKLVVVEQIYRALTIANNMPYHH